jgi:multiple sugar transport system ATP-binding protein
MNVYDNMAFALKLAKRPKADIDKAVRNAAEILDLVQHLQRKPGQLSGGQRQRVAMGRAIVRSPKAFLMDEPLSNLDAKLRVQMRTEVARIQTRLHTTTVYVTHDQTEAMTLGDRVAVLRAGVLQQVGKPMDLYINPVNLFVAGFIGSPGMNFVPATIDGDVAHLPMAEVRLPQRIRERIGRIDSKRTVIVGIRPEDFEDAALVEDAASRGEVFRTRIDVLEAMGAEYYAHFDVGGGALDSQELADVAADAGTAEVPGAGTGHVVARLPPESRMQEGVDADVFIDAAKLHVFDPQTGRSLAASSASRAARTTEVAG